MLSYYREGVQPDVERITNGARVNRDGYGFAIAAGDTLIIGKGMRADQVIEDFATRRKQHPEGPALFHSRMGTSGTYGLYNCHPFQVGGDQRTVIAHNGVLYSPPKGEPRSDTRIFAELVFPQRFRRLNRPAVRQAMETYIGSYNKIAVITVNPGYDQQGWLFGEKKGHWRDGEWHSNYDHVAWPLHYSSPLSDDWLAGEDKCFICGEAEAVDPMTAVCGTCGFCNDCLEEADTCLCYQPGKTWDSPAVAQGRT